MATAPPLEDESGMIRSPELPFVSAIVGGLFPGRAIVVSGMVLQSFASDTKRFSGQPDKQLVINSYISNRWGAEERFPNPFEIGQPFQIRILVLENYFKIAVNGKHICDYPHRVPVEEIKTIYVGGNIRVDFIEFQPPVRLNEDGHPIITQKEKREEKVTTLDRPIMPFSWAVPKELNGFMSPQSVRFTLTPFMSAKRFTCNLRSGDEYLFHFRVDFRQHNDKHSKVDVDGVHYVKFKYRVGDDPSLIDKITVEGDCVLQRFVHRA
ncbi:galactoside-binding lectin [Ancylostoma ceylanicum]|uniref:Galectin n=1 Tax=Ancylostoma ceylanicum TaxID=53326 RepID=A0A0D6M5R6_9BILA|nr:galactoside-binding lectin [Ancylostoma ceylanicum]